MPQELNTSTDDAHTGTGADASSSDDNGAASSAGASSSTDAPQDGKDTNTVEYWRKRSRQNEDRAKANAAAARELEQLKSANKSDVEKLTESNTDLTSRAAMAEQALMRYRAAVKAGVASEDVETFASRLQGDTADELDEDAQQLKQMFAGKSPEPERKRDRSQGATGGKTTPAQDFAAFMNTIQT